MKTLAQLFALTFAASAAPALRAQAPLTAPFDEVEFSGMPRIAPLPLGLQTVPNSVPYDIAVSGDTLFACGFDHVGYYTGPMALVNASTADVRTDWPLIEGTVRVMIPDGAGGWFVGGELYQIDGAPRTGVAHITEAGAVSGFAPVVLGGDVLALERVGATLYLGGEFESIDGVPRERLAAIDLGTNTVTSWNPNIGTNFGFSEYVRCLAVEDDTVFVGGRFTQAAGGAPRTNLYAVSATTGAVLSWAPQPNGTVDALERTSSKLAVVGGFTSISSQQRRTLALYDLASLALDPFNFTLTGSFRDAALEGDTLYLCGNLSLVNGLARQGGAAFDLASGTLLPWNPQLLRFGGQSAIPNCITTAPGLVVIGGDFFTASMQRRRAVAAVDPVTGDVLPWTADASGNGAHVFAMASDGESIAIGGDFEIAGGEQRGGAAAWNLTDGSLLPFDPRLVDAGGGPGVANSIAAANGRLYLGGTFRSVGGVDRPLFAAVDAVTGQLDPQFQVAGSFHPNSTFVSRIAVGGGRFYASGSFSLANSTMVGMAALDAFTGEPIPGFVSGSGSVTDLVLDSHNQRLFVSGSFGTIGLPSVVQGNLALLNANTGAVMNWNPQVSDDVISISRSGSTLVGVGPFVQVGGIIMRDLLRIDLVSATPIQWAVPPVFNGAPSGLVTDCGRFGLALFVAGGFTGLNNQTRSGLAAVNWRTGAVLDWAPNPDGRCQIDVFGNRLILSGRFRHVSGQRQPVVAFYTLETAGN